jgi:hypothetical protein
MQYINQLKRRVRERLVSTILIHIGKCGGLTVREALSKRGIQFAPKHVTSVQFSENKQYIILVRNPIARFASAFNWRYKLVVEEEKQANRFKGEKKMLQEYANANSLAENLYTPNGELLLDFKGGQHYIHHITEDIDFYIGEFLSSCNRENIAAVLATETLKDDLKSHFGIDVESQVNKNKKETPLSDLALENLVRYLEKDFDCIEKLNDMGLLSQKQYENLSCKSA